MKMHLNKETGTDMLIGKHTVYRERYEGAERDSQRNVHIYKKTD